MVVLSDDIFYRPHLQIPESFHTDGNPPRVTSIPSSDTTPSQDTQSLTFLKDACKKLLKSLVTLPVPLRKPIETGLLTVQFMLTLIPEKDFENIKKDTPPDTIHIIEHPPHEDETIHTKPIEDVLSDIFGSQEIAYITKSDIERINYRYYASLYDIMEDYIEKVKRALAEYNTTLLSQIDFENLDIAEKRYIADCQTLTQALGEDEGNISDLLVRQNAVKYQKLRLLNKLCNERISLTHIKSCELSRLLLVRYYNIKKNNHYFHDAALMQQIKTEVVKLDQKIEQLYKYLNTSVILVNECLMLHAHEAIAKQYLQDKVTENALDEIVTLFAPLQTTQSEEVTSEIVEETDLENETIQEEQSTKEEIKHD